ncbi:MAG: DUF1549 domain-containing protein [Planctomycetaceae bacterium]
MRVPSTNALRTAVMALALAAPVFTLAAPGVARADERLLFETDIQPILTARGCNAGGCHGKSGGKNGFALSLFGFDPDGDHRAIVSGARGRRVDFAAPARSLLLLKATGAEPHGGGKRIDEGSPDHRRLEAWIARGAPRAGPGDPRVAGLEIAPDPRLLAPGEAVALVAIARSTDGSSRDVTADCAWQSSEPVVVTVSAAGRATAGTLPGEATVMARYLGLIATWDTGVARPERITPDAFAALPRANFIDAFVYDRLRSLGIPPSPPCSDSTFLRRAHVDVIGRLPTAAEARAFLADGAPDKRRRLVAALLERGEYADYQANKWADLLRPNPYRVGIKATMALDAFLRDAFRRNLPHDAFVRALVTARGSTFRDGATTMFRDRRSPDEIVTMVSQLFLGTRLECAKCHQHPFERYGQGDFYSLAAFFARVGYRGTGLSPPISGGEEFVTVADGGEVRHPLTSAVLPPRPLLGEPVAIPAGRDPRDALVAWMTGPDNALFHRAAANRVWADLMGIGLVDPVDDLRATNPPSNPALLDALADEYRRLGMDTKRLIATIMESNVYGAASAPEPGNAGDHRHFSRHRRRRLRAEVLADAIDDLTGVPTAYPGAPPESRAVQLWTHRSGSTFLDVFGRPDPNQDPPCQRDPDATVVQALHLLNGPQIAAKIADDSGWAARLATGDASPAAVVEEIYLAAYARHPTSEERTTLEGEFAGEGRARREVVEDILWAVVNSAEFVYQD